MQQLNKAFTDCTMVFLEDTFELRRCPIYGCYVLGRDWYFMTLVGKQFCISRGYDASTEHVTDLFRILKALKAIINELTQ